MPPKSFMHNGFYQRCWRYSHLTGERTPFSKAYMIVAPKKAHERGQTRTKQIQARTMAWEVRQHT
jgi:hypothetical protein